VKILLDTRCWLWMLADPDRLPDDVRRHVADPANGVYLSVVSVWEIGQAHARGRLPLPEPPPEFVPDRIRRSGVLTLPRLPSHALRAGELPPYHADPVDRLLVAQAQLEGATIVTADRRFERYDVPLWPAFGEMAATTAS